MSDAKNISEQEMMNILQYESFEKIKESFKKIKKFLPLCEEDICYDSSTYWKLDYNDKLTTEQKLEIFDLIVKDKNMFSIGEVVRKMIFIKRYIEIMIKTNQDIDWTNLSSHNWHRDDSEAARDILEYIGKEYEKMKRLSN